MTWLLLIILYSWVCEVLFSMYYINPPIYIFVNFYEVVKDSSGIGFLGNCEIKVAQI